MGIHRLMEETYVKDSTARAFLDGNQKRPRYGLRSLFFKCK
ncbi:hypothetical protein SAMN06265218_11046 [Fodinibius sediminis]|uniref:Uncharacterized protein n=1 Tax=Fodinibius sediminis TaxID=1214077 RepID=A0A521DGH9_9BACT|nr:hypothetical protein SAMN06265218_11046 [Fodinibius sediminis]